MVRATQTVPFVTPPTTAPTSAPFVSRTTRPPGGPLAPVAPVGPRVPASPFSPFGPGSPASPSGPCGPTAPNLERSTGVSPFLHASRATTTPDFFFWQRTAALDGQTVIAPSMAPTT